MALDLPEIIPVLLSCSLPCRDPRSQQRDWRGRHEAKGCEQGCRASIKPPRLTFRLFAQSSFPSRLPCTAQDVDGLGDSKAKFEIAASDKVDFAPLYRCLHLCRVLVSCPLFYLLISLFSLTLPSSSLFVAQCRACFQSVPSITRKRGTNKQTFCSILWRPWCVGAGCQM